MYYQQIDHPERLHDPLHPAYLVLIWTDTKAIRSIKQIVHIWSTDGQQIRLTNVFTNHLHLEAGFKNVI